VLALQGDFACHRASLAGLDALVLPGGESTTMVRLIEANGLRGPLLAFARTKPVMGTCAGVILLATSSDRLPFPTLGALDATVERNAYGRQIDSFTATVEAPALGGDYRGVFIRAPRIVRAGGGVEIVATLPPRAGRAAELVAVRQGRIVGLTFHPELTSDLRFHRWFLTEVAGLEVPAPAPPAPAVRGPEARA
jgi:5'-phosphate synthase pdxT subunit